MQDEPLHRAIKDELDALEKEGEVVICSSSAGPAAERITQAALGVVPHTGLTLSELFGVRSLILHAIADPNFFDWEMPTLTGFTAAEFRRIAEKLPRE